MKAHEAAEILRQIKKILFEAVKEGKKFSYEVNAGDRPLEYVLDKEGRLCECSELDGNYEIHIRIMAK
jgi:hypothetical protein